MHGGRLGARHLSTDCSNWGGKSAATSGSIIDGVQGIPSDFANTQQNWSRWVRTSFWAQLPLSSRTCNRRAAPSLSYSFRPLTQLAQGLLPAWRGLAATPLVSPHTSLV